MNINSQRGGSASCISYYFRVKKLWKLFLNLQKLWRESSTYHNSEKMQRTLTNGCLKKKNTQLVNYPLLLLLFILEEWDSTCFDDKPEINIPKSQIDEYIRKIPSLTCMWDTHLPYKGD